MGQQNPRENAGLLTNCKCTCHRSLTCSYVHTKTYPKGVGLSKRDPSDPSKITEAATKYFSHDEKNGKKVMTKIHGALCPNAAQGVYNAKPFHSDAHNVDTDKWTRTHQKARDNAQRKTDQKSHTPWKDPYNMGLYPDSKGLNPVAP